MDGAGSKDLGRLETHLGYWLRFVANHVSGGFSQQLADHDVTVPEWVALRSLAVLGACTLNQLAQEMGTDAGSASRIVDKMVKRGHAIRRPSTEDRRAITVQLAKKGAALVPTLSKAADENDEFFFGHLEPSVRRQLVDALKGIAKQHKMKGEAIE